jgi:hypothetical protein
MRLWLICEGLKLSSTVTWKKPRPRECPQPSRAGWEMRDRQNVDNLTRKHVCLILLKMPELITLGQKTYYEDDCFADPFGPPPEVILLQPGYGQTTAFWYHLGS